MTEYEQGFGACLQAVCAAYCVHCQMGTAVQRDDFGWSHPWTHEGVALRCWATRARDAAAAELSARIEAGRAGGEKG